jgi:hypothetical protein
VGWAGWGEGHLEVTVDDVARVQVVDGQQHLGRVEARRRVVEPPGVAQVCEELAAHHVLHEHVQALRVLCGETGGERGWASSVLWRDERGVEEFPGAVSEGAGGGAHAAGSGG